MWKRFHLRCRRVTAQQIQESVHRSLEEIKDNISKIYRWTASLSATNVANNLLLHQDLLYRSSHDTKVLLVDCSKRGPKILQNSWLLAPKTGASPNSVPFDFSDVTTIPSTSESNLMLLEFNGISIGSFWLGLYLS